MLTFQEVGLFALTTLVLVLTPGPNMIYCVSRALSQGRAAGMLSLCGVLLGFVAHLLAATLGLTALLAAVPLAFDALRIAGAAYLLWLAWDAVRPGGSSPFVTRALPVDAPGKLFRMGLLTNLLNPKVALFYLSFFPQFLHPERGDVLAQAAQLGAVQIVVSGTINALLIVGAARISGFLARSSGWLAAQRYLMGTVLGAMAARIAVVDTR
ncbi:MAG TPA: LysE family translocator [Ramlibacter sp.]|jgi:threonine/homoserine/homoserine lactone efflux protein|nr:LysE family translocator [Ramlibacter sp.]